MTGRLQAERDALEHEQLVICNGIYGNFDIIFFRRARCNGKEKVTDDII